MRRRDAVLLLNGFGCEDLPWLTASTCTGATGEQNRGRVVHELQEISITAGDVGRGFDAESGDDIVGLGVRGTDNRDADEWQEFAKDVYLRCECVGYFFNGAEFRTGLGARSDVQDSVGLVARDKIDAPLRSPVVIPAGDDLLGMAIASERSDGVDKSAHRIDGGTVRGRQRLGEGEVRPVIQGCAVEKKHAHLLIVPRRRGGWSRGYRGGVEDLSRRLNEAAQRAEAVGLQALLISPGPDLRYVAGYEAVPLERLTCLVVPGVGEPTLVVPALERAAALESGAGRAGVTIAPWRETEDPYAVVASLLSGVTRVGVDEHMTALQVIRLRDAMPGVRQELASPALGPLRMRKSPSEIASLAAAGAAIDRVHEQVAGLLRPGRTEREVGRDIAELIIGEGHARVDFVIVASGPNAASPHHEVSDRRLQPGDSIVVDIGGTMPDGYCSDETRTYALGDPDPEFLAAYAVLQRAQAAASGAVRPGITCEDLDETARAVLVEAGLGDLFIHRLGHGIGLDTHEEPYIVEGNAMPLETGMAFSIEPGFYVDGRFGARIEDIVACGEDAAIVLNHRPRELVVVA